MIHYAVKLSKEPRQIQLFLLCWHFHWGKRSKLCWCKCGLKDFFSLCSISDLKVKKQNIFLSIKYKIFASFFISLFSGNNCRKILWLKWSSSFGQKPFGWQTFYQQTFGWHCVHLTQLWSCHLVNKQFSDKSLFIQWVSLKRDASSNW